MASTNEGSVLRVGALLEIQSISAPHDSRTQDRSSIGRSASLSSSARQFLSLPLTSSREIRGYV